MIGKDRIAEALRFADALAEEHHNLPEFFTERDIDPEGVVYVAMQHGLRAVMMKKGMSPNPSQPTSIRLTREEQITQMEHASSFLVGFATYAQLQKVAGGS